jgi:Sulfotransferase family
MSANGKGPRRFFLIGAMKAGTSTMYKYLADHPLIYATPRKEPKFFSKANPTAADVAAYAALFAGRTSEPWAFEASTAYTKFPMISGVPGRIHSAHPDARLIYMLRDPVERLCSAYLHNRAEGREQRPFEEAVFGGSQEYLNVSRYHLQLDQYVRMFPRDQILVLLFEDFVAEPDKTLADIARFLHLEPGFGPIGAARRYNETSKKRAPIAALRALRKMPGYRLLPARVKLWMSEPMTRTLPSKHDLLDDRLYRRLIEELAPDVSQLQKLLGREFNCWKSLSRVN